MRKMIGVLQEVATTGQPWKLKDNKFNDFIGYLKAKDMKSIYDTVYSGDFDMEGFKFENQTPAVEKSFFDEQWEHPQSVKVFGKKRFSFIFFRFCSACFFIIPIYFWKKFF